MSLNAWLVAHQISSFPIIKLLLGTASAKHLHIDLTKLKSDNLAQKQRYLKVLPNLIYTNRLDFEFYKSEENIRFNFNPEIYAEICRKAGLGGVKGHELKVFDYIYGVLHSPEYRSTYAEFLKSDFPRIPYPASPETFGHIADKGEQLRLLHLMDDAAVGTTPYPFKGAGSGIVEKPIHTDEGKVFINPHQWFEGVPRIAWEFHIGGYQPAQKWLKDRKGRVLSFDDVRHYQKIITILSETDRIMGEIKLPLSQYSASI